MFKNYLSLCRFTTVIFFFAHDANTSEILSGKKQYSCNDGASFYHCSDGKMHEISQKTYQLTGEGSDVAIEVSGEDTVVEGKVIIINGVSSTNGHSENNSWTTGVKASNGGGVALFDSMLNNVSIGADVNEEGAFDIQDGVIKATRIGISVAGKRSFVALTNTEIETPADAIGLLSHNGAKIYVKGGKINFSSGIGVQTGGDGEINLDGVSIIGKGKQATNTDNHRETSAFSMLQGKGALNFQKGNVNVDKAHGIILQGNNNNVAHIKNSNVFVRGNTFQGMRFFWEAVLNETKTIIPGKGTVHLTKTSFMVPESIAIYSRQFESFVKLSQHSKISGDSLLKAVEHSNVKIEADASTLVGGAHVDKSSTAKIELKNNSKWILSQPKHDKLQNFDTSGSKLGDYSFISSVDLMNSSLVFQELKSKTTDGYQTLLIGKGSGLVYRAQGDARLYLNVYLDKGGALQEQKTDRLLINGDILGKTIVHVYGVPGSPGEFTGDGGNDQGISIIQVYGQAAKDSFQLNGGYVTLQNSPYQYHLMVYGPDSALKEADTNQKVLKNAGTFWDFRLESKFVEPISLDPTVDSVVSLPFNDISPLSKIHPRITESKVEAIDANSNQKTQESELSSPVVSPDKDSHLTFSLFDVSVPKVRNSSPTSLAPVIVDIAEPEPVVPSSSSPPPSIIESFTSSSSVPASVSSPPSIIESSTSGSSVPASVSSPPSIIESSTSGSSVPASVSSPPSIIESSTSGSSVPASVSSPPSIIESSTSGSSVPASVSSPPSIIESSTSGSSVPASVSSPPSIIESSTSGSSVPASVSSPPSIIESSTSGSSVPASVSSPPSIIEPSTSGSSVPASVFELSSHFERNVRAVVPQVLTYILVPNTLFYAGLMDINSQNKQLQTLRTFSRQLLKINENPTLFLRGYGGHYHYTSNLSALEYGYGGDLDYNAIEASVLLKKIESAYSTTAFGVMGNYGKLSLQPREVKQSQKSIFNKWTITAYGSMQHDTGLYMDGLFSYGLFNGNVFTLERGKTAALRGKPLSISLTAGKTFMIGCRYFIFEPQVQFVYQNLQFHKTRDIDHFNIDMRRPDHWGVRIGGYLTKTLTFTKDADILSFYGRFHFIRNFDDKQFVHFKDAFQLGSFGSSLEAGLGVYSQLSPKIIFHSDMIYQHKFTKAGFSGTHFSGGLSYHF